jgi:hypothetical protein
LLVACVVVFGFSFYAQNWIAGAGILCLWFIWAFLHKTGSSAVLAVALSFQWVQVTCGVYYYALTGRQVDAMLNADYGPMVLMGLGCITALVFGLVLGQRLVSTDWIQNKHQYRLSMSWQFLVVGYITSFVLGGFLLEIAWYFPMLTQGILALTFVRLAILYLMFRRVVFPRFRWQWFVGLLAFETLMGFTGFFAGFREPLVLALLALLEVFDSRSVAHWTRLGGVLATMACAGLLWMGIRTDYRKEYETAELSSRAGRMERVGSLSTEWFTGDLAGIMSDMDSLVDRIWAIYYPALAVSRVPAYLPHEDGAILWGAVRHNVMPRILFPDKPVLPSDSEMVRKYSGVLVASTEQNTSIAFGYAVESYIDFGVPWMFLPSLVFGVLMGLLYRALHRAFRCHELTVAFTTVVFWLTLYVWERSWVKTLGLTGTLIIYLGGLVWLLDRWLLREQGASSRVTRSRGIAVPTGR